MLVIDTHIFNLFTMVPHATIKQVSLYIYGTNVPGGLKNNNNRFSQHHFQSDFNLRH